MDKLQVEALLILVSTLDQRKITNEAVDAWSSLLADVKPQHAREAVEAHFREKPDTYLNVGHVVKGAKVCAERDAQHALSAERGMDESQWRSDPQPVCRDHNLPITRCDNCCYVLSEKWFWSADERHSWALKNVYQAVA